MPGCTCRRVTRPCYLAASGRKVTGVLTDNCTGRVAAAELMTAYFINRRMIAVYNVWGAMAMSIVTTIFLNTYFWYSQASDSLQICVKVKSTVRTSLEFRLVPAIVGLLKFYYSYSRMLYRPPYSLGYSEVKPRSFAYWEVASASPCDHVWSNQTVLI